MSDEDRQLPKGWRIAAIRLSGQSKYKSIRKGKLPSDLRLQAADKIVIEGPDANGKKRYWTLNGGAENMTFIQDVIKDIQEGKWKSPK